MSNWLKVDCITELSADDIEDIIGIVDQDGEIYIRIIRKHPYIDILCKDYKEAKRVFQELTKQLKVVNLQSYKNGK